jgi:E3 ubiquitin-protein ligase RNF115/126
MYYSTSNIKTYWCHICRKEFQKLYIENTDIQCQYCSNNFCEELGNVDQIDHPSNFRPYERQSSITSTNSSIPLIPLNLPRTSLPRTSSSFLDMILGLLNGYEESNLESIIHSIMMSDTNRYGNPPASTRAINSLERIVVNEENVKSLAKDSDNSCSVCKDAFEVSQNVIYMPCKHLYHNECILPWLKERNSCPTCRYELPTDDTDYENRKNA